MAARESERADRGVAIVLTPARWALCASALAIAFVAAVELYVVMAHSERTLAGFTWLVVAFVVVEAVVVLAILRAEESRLARELRTARTGSARLRGLVARRRQQMPFLARLFATRLGTAAVLLADGERSAALDALAASSLLMQGGRLERLRAFVEADAERALGNPAALERCVRRLVELPRMGHREADLYRTHVLVKALLEQGDAEGALGVVDELESASDDEERVYGVWLRVWLDLEAQRSFGPLGEGLLRLAALTARAHGADKLVEKLDERIATIARPDGQG